MTQYERAIEVDVRYWGKCLKKIGQLLNIKVSQFTEIFAFYGNHVKTEVNGDFVKLS